MKGPKTKIGRPRKPWTFEPPRSRGRPRSEQARQEILETAYNLLRDKGFNAIGSHEIAQAAGVSSATLYRWWNSKEEILFDACFEQKPDDAIPDTGSGLPRLRRSVLRTREFMVSEEGAVMARLVTGIHENKRLRQVFLKRYVKPLHQILHKIIEETIASGELERTTDPQLLIDALYGPLYFRWLQGHAPLDKAFAERIFKKVIAGFRPD